MMTILRSSAPVVAATDWTEVAALVQLATAVIAVIAVVSALAQLTQNRRGLRATRAHQYLERHGHPDEIPLFAELLDFILADTTEQAARIKEWEAMSYRERLRVLHGLNFWEELAGMYGRNLVDRKIVREYFGSPALFMWSSSEWFIDYERDKPGGTELMVHFSEMCDEIRMAQEAESRRTSRGRDPAEPTTRTQEGVTASQVEARRTLDELRRRLPPSARR